jgi:hypothetical protein
MMLRAGGRPFQLDEAIMETLQLDEAIVEPLLLLDEVIA